MHIRKGNIDDLIWIGNLLIEGANEGHFGPSMSYQAMVFLQAVIQSGGVQMIKLRGGIKAPVFVPMELTVAEVDGNPASFLICCKEGSDVEIHLAATIKRFRKNGCFSKLVMNAIINNSNCLVYARCYKKSTSAIKGLKKLNFKPTKKGNPIELTLAK